MRDMARTNLHIHTKYCTLNHIHAGMMSMGNREREIGGGCTSVSREAATPLANSCSLPRNCLRTSSASSPSTSSPRSHLRSVLKQTVVHGHRQLLDQPTAHSNLQQHVGLIGELVYTVEGDFPGPKSEPGTLQCTSMTVMIPPLKRQDWRLICPC